MTMPLIAACLQITSGPDIQQNLDMIAPMIDAAHARGATLITLPENTDIKTANRATLFERAQAEADHPGMPFFRRKAKETGAWILAGSMIMKTDHDKLANRSYLFNPAGEIAARYDKIHLFDADVGANESYRESNNFKAGSHAVLAETPWGKVGLTICYDVRFPHLHRALAKAGATIIMAPAAFTVPTGRLHWHTLLRARAIETGCYIIAAAQCGIHDGGRQTYGHSLIVAPDGTIIVEAGEEPEIITAELDMVNVAEARRMLPSLQHDREFDLITGT